MIRALIFEFMVLPAVIWMWFWCALLGMELHVVHTDDDEVEE